MTKKNNRGNVDPIVWIVLGVMVIFGGWAVTKAIAGNANAMSMNLLSCHSPIQGEAKQGVCRDSCYPEWEENGQIGCTGDVLKKLPSMIDSSNARVCCIPVSEPEFYVELHATDNDGNEAQLTNGYKLKAGKYHFFIRALASDSVKELFKSYPNDNERDANFKCTFTYYNTKSNEYKSIPLTGFLKLNGDFVSNDPVHIKYTNAGKEVKEFPLQESTVVNLACTAGSKHSYNLQIPVIRA